MRATEISAIGVAMNYWLLKSEPSSFSIDDLQRAPNKTTNWDGVRNYQARNFMRDQMKRGDLAFFYQSNCDIPGIVGVVEIVREGYPDVTAFDSHHPYYDPKSDRHRPRWFMVDVRFRQKFSSVISLDSLKKKNLLSDLMILRKGNRLSITPVTKEQWDIIHQMVHGA